MSVRDLNDYTDIESLLRSDEWRIWVKFVRTRINHLKEKVIRLVRDKNYEDAGKTVAVLDDLDKQLDLFRNMKNVLDEKLQNTGGR